MKHIIVYGPKGCGKTHNRMAIAEHFDADLVVDDWQGNMLFQPNVKGPFIGGKVVKSGWRETPCHTVVYLITSLNCEHPLPSPVPDCPQGDRVVIYNYAHLAFVRKESDDKVTIPDDAPIFGSTRNETDNAPAIENDYVDDEDLMRTIIDAHDELRDRGYDVSISNHPDPALLANTNTTHVTLIKKLKGEPK